MPNLNNPWCLVHQGPMINGGKDFVCPGHWTTRKQASAINRPPHKEFAVASAATTGRVRRYRLQRDWYPWCVNCRRRMMFKGSRTHSGWTGFKCSGCGVWATTRYTRKATRYLKEKQIIELIGKQYSNYRIRKLVGCSWQRVQEVRNEIQKLLS